MNEATKKQIKTHQRIGFIKDFLVVLFLFLYYFIPVLVSTLAHSPEYLWTAFLPLPLFIGAIIYLIWRGEKFKKMIFIQVQNWQCNLDSESKKMTFGVYISRNWLIVSGRFAVCRYNIKRGAHKEAHSKGGISYVIKIATRDNQTYRFRISDFEKMQKIKRWIRNS